MMKIPFLFVLFVSFYTFGQSNSGVHGFQFLNSFYTARNIGTGNNLISVFDADITLAAENPALLSDKMDKSIAVNQSLMPTGVNFGSFQYAFRSKVGIFSPIVKYVNFGQFTAMDEAGVAQGQFGALDYSLGMNYSRKFNPVLSLGVGVQLFGSNLERYFALGFSSTFAATYRHKNELFSAAILVKGIGFTFKEYTTAQKTPLPIDVQASLTYKLKHAPFRFSILAKQLNKWDIVYQDPNAKPTYDALTGDTIPVEIPGFGEKLAHHFSLQVELLASKTLHFRTGFDFHRQQQLSVYNRPGLAGFSFGVGLNFKKIRFDYGFLIYSKAGQNHAVGLSTNLSDWKRKS